MAQEIEQYLMDKFRNGLDGKDKSISKIPRYNQFQEIKTLLEDIFSSSLPVESSIRDKLYCLNNVLTECQMLTRKHGFNSPEELLTINRIRRQLNKIKRELKVITDNKRSSHENIDPQPISQVISQDGHLLRWTTRSVDASKVYGFDDDVVSMKKILFQQGSVDRFKAVGIVGRDGIGKTTLCQLLFNEQEVKNTFLPRIWVCLARHPGDDDDEDPKIVVVKRMLLYLGVGKKMVKSIFEKHGLTGLLYALHLQLVGKKYLIVLDDAREMDSWYLQLDLCLTHDKKWDDGLAFGLPKGHGGRVIVTSRNEEIAELMVGEENIHHLLPLSDHESCWAIFKDAVENNRIQSSPSNLEDLTDNESYWAIFKDAVENDGILSNPSHLEDLKLEVKGKCEGLPLAAKMMGQALKELRKEQPRDESVKH